MKSWKSSDRKFEISHMELLEELLKDWLEIILRKSFSDFFLFLIKF